MAVSLPSLDQMTGARAGEYLPDHVDQYQPYQSATRWNSLGEVDLSQGDGSSLTPLDTTRTQMWTDASKAYADTSTLHVGHDGALFRGYERVQSVPGLELNFGIAEATASGHERQQADSCNTSPSNDRQFELLTFPEGEVDAVTIRASDLDGLQPMRFLSNNIIDFYIKYLERGLSSRDKNRFFFFSSFFFTKLAGSCSASTNIDVCEVDYDQVLRWTTGVNLFEKDYVFIPILKSSHWSLIIICHLSSLTILPDKNKGSPCILHLDPIEEKHESFEGQVRRYLYRACRERYQASNKKDDMLEALACSTKYVRAQVPRQDNSYDCGVYVLHYVEVFIRESISPDFSFVTSEGGPHLTGAHFTHEVSEKRAVIENVVYGLSNTSQGQATRRLGTQPKPLPRASDAHSPISQPKSPPNLPKGQNKNSLSKKWEKNETSELLNGLVDRGRIRKGTEGPTHWQLASQDIQTKLGTIRSEDECRRRYDTLLKAYKKVKKTGKPFCDITDAERREVNLATPLIEEWYDAIDKICLQRGSDNGKSRKRAKLSPSDGNGMLSSNPRNPPPPPLPLGCPEPERPSPKQVAIPGFSNLDEGLRSTLVNLIQTLSTKYWSSRNDEDFGDLAVFELEEACRWLAFIQDRKPRDVRICIFRLLELELVNVGDYNDWVEGEAPCFKVSNVRLYKKFVEKVLRKNPHLNIYLEVCNDFDSVSFPKVPLSSAVQRIRVLSLYECEGLEHADLSYFPELRSLAIMWCEKLKAVTGWEVVKELGSLEIYRCKSYVGFPPVQCLPSLREFRFKCDAPLGLQRNPVPDFSQCVRLRRLEICGDDSSALNSVDLSTLRFLEVLTFSQCEALTTMQGLSGLHSLTTLSLEMCKALRRVPELGCLKALTHLNMGGSGVEEIPGVQDLHLLTELFLWHCRSLKTLPWLGHLKALVRLDIEGTGVEEIPGVQDLVSLERLDCEGSRLKWLPELHHLPRLRRVWVVGTPLSITDSLSFYHGKDYVKFNAEEERTGFNDEFSDISDDDSEEDWN